MFRVPENEDDFEELNVLRRAEENTFNRAPQIYRAFHVAELRVGGEGRGPW